MTIEFDPAKDAASIAKHGVSLSRAVDLEILVFLEDAGTGAARSAIAPGVNQPSPSP